MLSSFVHVDILSLEIEAIEGKASPRKPDVLTFCKSSNTLIFDVACFLNAFSASARSMPFPSSLTAIKEVPPSSILIQIFLAPASREFSTSSLTTDAGLSITSPAAIWLIVCSSKIWISGINVNSQLSPL